MEDYRRALGTAAPTLSFAVDRVPDLRAVSVLVPIPRRALRNRESLFERSNATFVADGVIVHSDAGSQYTSLAFTEKLLDLGLAPSIGRVGTAYDNALIESTIGLYKTELVH